MSCAAGSAQEVWLKADLAANAAKYCTLAFWHDPRFNSGHDGNADEMKPLFQALYDANADVVLARARARLRALRAPEPERRA